MYILDFSVRIEPLDAPDFSQGWRGQGFGRLMSNTPSNKKIAEYIKAR